MKRATWGGALVYLMLVIAACGCERLVHAQASATASGTATPGTAVRQLGTVRSIEGPRVVLGTDAGKTVTVTVQDGARVLQLAPGSTDLKTAQVITLGGIAVGDRVLVTGKPGGAEDTVTATRLILMKSTDIADKRATEQQEWRKNGTSGTVNALTGSTLVISTGTRKLMVATTPTTVYRRYAGDSVKYGDAKLGSVQQIQVGDQVSVRGTQPVTEDSLTAVEVVSGSFKNLSGVITAIDTASGTVAFKDLTTKQPVKVTLTANSDLRRLPPEIAARFATRSQGGAAGGASAAGGGAGRPAGAPAAPSVAGTAVTSSVSGQRPAGSGAGSSGGRAAGADLSRMLERLPQETVADVKVGDSVMIVASSQPGAAYTAVTLLSGVESILSATATGSAPVTLSPWNLGAPEGGGQ